MSIKGTSMKVDNLNLNVLIEGVGEPVLLLHGFPDQTDAILKRGKEFGTGRNICNVHWHSDVVAGRTMGAATVARLHANNQFLIDMGAAKKEISSLLDTRKNKI